MTDDQTFVPCPFCAIQGVGVQLRWRRAWLMPPQAVCPRCQPNWRTPALWRRVVRRIVDWITSDGG